MSEEGRCFRVNLTDPDKPPSDNDFCYMMLEPPAPHSKGKAYVVSSKGGKGWLKWRDMRLEVSQRAFLDQEEIFENVRKFTDGLNFHLTDRFVVGLPEYSGCDSDHPVKIFANLPVEIRAAMEVIYYLTDEFVLRDMLKLGQQNNMVDLLMERRLISLGSAGDPAICDSDRNWHRRKALIRLAHRIDTTDRQYFTADPPSKYL